MRPSDLLSNRYDSATICREVEEGGGRAAADARGAGLRLRQALRDPACNLLNRAEPLASRFEQLGRARRVALGGGEKCGADHSPSVFADTARYRSFILDPTPTWGPTQHATVTVKGAKTLTCSASPRERGTTLSYVWKRSVDHTRLKVVGTGAKHKRTMADKGHRLVCFAYASNDGGEVLAGLASA